MQNSNSVKDFIARDTLVMDILCSEFGFCTVSQAMNHRASYKNAKKEKFSIISEHFNKLSYEWQMGNARAYLESLATDLQYYIICYLMEDSTNDKTSSEV